jgi:hypothetical protein
MEYVYHIVTICVNETSWTHVWRLRSHYLGTGYDSDLLYHHHDLRGISTVVESVRGDAENLLQYKVKDGERLLLHIIPNQVPLIPGAAGGISHPWSLGGTKEMVKSVKLRMEVLNLGWSCLSTRSIQEKHIIRLENIVGVNLII